MSTPTKEPPAYRPAVGKTAAPPVYRPSTNRPQQTNKPSLQVKAAGDFSLEMRPAPPVYRPQQTNKPSLQVKVAGDFSLEVRPAPLARSFASTSLHKRLPTQGCGCGCGGASKGCKGNVPSPIQPFAPYNGSVQQMRSLKSLKNAEKNNKKKEKEDKKKEESEKNRKGPPEKNATMIKCFSANDCSNESFLFECHSAHNCCDGGGKSWRYKRGGDCYQCSQVSTNE